MVYKERLFVVKSRVARFGPKVGQISTKSDKSGTFSIQISLHFNSPSQNVLKSDVKKCPRFVYMKIIEAATVLNRIKGK